jgi:hypothetical protein
VAAEAKTLSLHYVHGIGQNAEKSMKVEYFDIFEAVERELHSSGDAQSKCFAAACCPSIQQ